MAETNTTERLQSQPDDQEKKSSKYTEQLQWKKRSPPPAPGLLPVTVDNIITNFHQLGNTVSAILVILTSFGYKGGDKAWIILSEVLIVLISFAFYIKYICKHILIWDKFFRKIDNWYSRKYDQVQNGDAGCRTLVFINVVWWLYAILIFPVIILYSAWESYKWYKNYRRDDVNTDVSTINFDSNRDLDVAEQENYTKHALNTFSVSYLGVLSKQAACLMCFLQDIPLFIISSYIVNVIGLTVFSISIVWKLINWFKYMYDVKGCRCFYKYDDFWDYFQLKKVEWEKLEDFGIEMPVPIYYTDAEKYKSRLQPTDWVKVWNETEKQWDLACVYKNYYHGKDYNIIVVDMKNVNFDALKSDLENGGHHSIAEEAVMKLNRWNDIIQPLNEEELQMLENEDEHKDINKDDNVQDAVQITMPPNSEQRTELEQQTVDENAEQKISRDDNKNDGSTDNDKNEDDTAGSVISNDEQQIGDTMKESEEDQLIGDSPVIVDKMNEDDAGDKNKNVNNYQAVPLNEDDI